MARVFVGMSGGVDSSLVAALLQEQGHDVVGVTLHIAPGCDDDGCCGASAIHDAKMVCADLGIPHYVVNRRDLFLEKVFNPFLTGTAAGMTMNPCVGCNEEIKFGALLDWSLQGGADFLATGHYARIVETNGQHRLAAASDPKKDQSYFQYRLSSEQLAHVMFPLGGFDKTAVRLMAAERNIRVAGKKDSQGVCFIPSDYDDFMYKNLPHLCVKGNTLDVSGKVIGDHRGATFYTLGQRRGGFRFNRGVSSPEQLMVVDRDVVANTVTLGTMDDLLVSEQHITDVIWHFDDSSASTAVVHRYHGNPIPAEVSFDADTGTAVVRYALPQRRVAPGQSVVFYDESGVVMGGGFAS